MNMKLPTSISSLTRVHCIGIGGIGVSAAAKYLHELGIVVSGSDASDSEIVAEVRKLGIAVFMGEDAESVPTDASLVIYSPAVQPTHAERVRAKQLNIPEMSYPEFLALLSQKKYTIAVTGTHGKSTTTALIGSILKNAGFDPTVIVGSRCPMFSHGNLNFGSSNILVVEACEYQGNMRLLHPNIAVVTNIEWDHPDYYKDADAVYQTMQQFVSGLPTDGVLVKNYDDKLVRGKLHFGGKTVTVGLAEGANLAATDILTHSGASYFTVAIPVKSKFTDQRFSLRVPGRFNISNALSAIAVAAEMNVPLERIQSTLAEFRGIWRRFEVVGTWRGATVISDYAHHPTAVRATIQAAREWYPGQRIVAVYQPHQHARTKELFADFVDAFHGADLTLMSDIYDVQGREEIQHQDITSATLVAAIQKSNARDAVHATGDLRHTQARLREVVQKDDVILIMGAGDIDTLARKLVK